MATRLVKRTRIAPQDASKDPLERLRQNTRTPLMPVSFAAALTVYMGEQKRNNRSRLQRIRNAWLMAIEQVPGVNAQAAAAAEVRNVAKTGAVHATLDNPSLAHELGVVYKQALFDKMRELLHGRDTISELMIHSRGGRRKDATRGTRRNQARK